MKQLDRIEEYFGKNAADWQDLYARPRRVNDLVLADRRRIAVDEIRRRVAPGRRILDAGCGAGLVALDLLDLGFTVHGVDIAQNMVDLCERRLREAGVPRDRYQLSRADVTSSQLAPGSFDGALALGFLEYQEDELAGLRHFHRLLAPGGTFVVSAPTGRKLANYLGAGPRVRRRLEQLRLLPEGPPPLGLALRGYSIGRLRRLLREAGFDPIAWHGHGYVEFEGIAGWMSYDGQVRLHHAFTRLSRFLPIDRWGNNLIAVARRPE